MGVSDRPNRPTGRTEPTDRTDRPSHRPHRSTDRTEPTGLFPLVGSVQAVGQFGRSDTPKAFPDTPRASSDTSETSPKLPQTFPIHSTHTAELPRALQPSGRFGSLGWSIGAVCQFGRSVDRCDRFGRFSRFGRSVGRSIGGSNSPIIPTSTTTTATTAR